MPTITLFEHQKRSYVELGWSPAHAVFEQIERLNQAHGAELIRLGRTYVQATAYVGVMRVGDHVLEVLPKIDDTSGGAEAPVGSPLYHTAVDSATRNLLYLLSYTQDLQLREQDVAPLLGQRSDWFELLTRLLGLNLHRLIQSGLDRAYVAYEETLPVLRGRWQIQHQLLRRSYVGHVFDVAYDEFSPDTALNQVFQFVVGRLLLQTRDRANRRLLIDLRQWLAGVRALQEVPPALLQQIHFSRLNERFRPAFNLARLFVENRAFNLTCGDQDTFAFVFDMNRLFEEFVYRFIDRFQAEILPPCWRDVRVVAQADGRHRYLLKPSADGQPIFRLRPDLLFVRPSPVPVLIADTKYKRLDAARHHYGIAESDVYQMLAYALQFSCPHLLLLYPRWSGSPAGTLAFETSEGPNHLTVATLDLSRPLQHPGHLIAELKQIFEEVSQHGTLC